MRTPRTITIEQIYANTRLERATQCRLWQGTVKKRTGLPQISLNGRKMYVTRLVWELHHGGIPHGASIVHVHHCPYSNCVNVAHLVKVSNTDAWRYRKNQEETVA